VKQYEAIFIIKPALDDKQIDGVMLSATSMITKKGGNVIKDEKWGKRVLAYPIKKQKEGVYYKVDFDADADKISDLKREYSLNLDILRTMIVCREA
jgi:small subunit ribosomal protein S6